MTSKRFYTYEYRRLDESPYYVGKGYGNRVYHSVPGHRPPNDHSRIRIMYWPDEATAFAYERYLIDFWGRKDNGTGILRNLSDGGEGSSNPSPKTRKKLSRRLSGNQYALGKHWILSQGTRDSMSKVAIERLAHSAHPALGRHHTAEAKAKIARHGEQNAMAKLTRTLVESIRCDLETGMVQRRIAEKYHVCPQTITLIKQNKIWRAALCEA